MSETLIQGLPSPGCLMGMDQIFLIPGGQHRDFCRLSVMRDLTSCRTSIMSRGIIEQPWPVCFGGCRGTGAKFSAGGAIRLSYSS